MAVQGGVEPPRALASPGFEPGAVSCSACCTWRCERESNPQGLAPRPGSGRVPSPIGLSHRAPHATLVVALAVTDQTQARGGLQPDDPRLLCVWKWRSDRGSNPEGHRCLARIATACRRQLSACRSMNGRDPGNRTQLGRIWNPARVPSAAPVVLTPGLEPGRGCKPHEALNLARLPRLRHASRRWCLGRDSNPYALLGGPGGKPLTPLPIRSPAHTVDGALGGSRTPTPSRGLVPETSAPAKITPREQRWWARRGFEPSRSRAPGARPAATSTSRLLAQKWSPQKESNLQHPD